jgi:hypothetical protein
VIKSCIGEIQYRFDWHRNIVSAQRYRSDTHADACDPVHDGSAVRYCPAYLFGALRQTSRIAPVQYNQEFLTSVTADGVIGSHCATQTCRHFTKHRITRQMTVDVIDPLEVIDIA